MNKYRRPLIERLQDKIVEIRGLVEDLIYEVEGIKDEEQEAYDNLPENFQKSDRGYAMDEAIGNLNNALSCLESDIYNALDEVEDYLEEAKQC